MKKLLLAHGEKLLLILIVFLGVGLLYAHLMRPADELLLPNYKTVKVNPQELTQRLGEVEKIFNKSDRNRPPFTPNRVAQRLARAILNGEVAGSVSEWFTYCQPAPIGVPQNFRDMESGVAQNIPAEMRTRFGNAENLTVRAGVGQVLITVRDAAVLNFPEPHSRQMLVYRKAIGSVKDDLSPEQRAVLTVSPRAETALLGLAEEAKPAAPTKSPVASGWGGKAKPAEVATVEKNNDSGWEAYVAAFTQKDQQADNELDIITNDDLLLETGWELLTERMFVVKGEISDSDVARVFIEGLTPEIVEMSPEQLAAYNAQQKTAEAATGTSAKTPTIASAAKGRERVEIKAEPQKIIADESNRDDGTPRQYAFVDKTAKENLIYRYAVLAAVRPRKPDAAMLQKLKITDWDIYCEVQGIDKVGCFAPPQRLLEGLLFDITKDADDKNIFTLRPQIGTEKKKSVKSPHLLDLIKTAYAPETEVKKEKPTAPAAEGDEAAVDYGPAAKSLRDPRNNRLSPTGWGYRNQELCFADFVSSDLILTPSKYDFALRSGTNEKQARIEVYKVEDNGENVRFTFTVNAPELPRKLTTADFLLKKEGKVVNPPQLLPLMEVYNTPELMKITPVLIGGNAKAEVISAEAMPTENAKATTKKKDTDFDSNWGVIDIRPYKVLQRTYAKDKRSGEWKEPTLQYFPNPDPKNNYLSAVIAEIKPAAGQPRMVRRLYARIKEKPNTDDKRYEYEIIPDPELHFRLMEQQKKAAVKTAAPEKPATE